jgi:ribosomal-protein-alanine N-acetyltransferase
MISYRQATALDLPVLVSLDREYFAQTAWPIEQFRAELPGKTRNFLIAENDGEIIGYASVYLPSAGGAADIMTIAVKPEFRRKGIATHFINELTEWAQSRGADAMMLEVDVSNSDAIALYEKLGYEKLNIRKNYYGAGIDAQIMKRGL